MPYVYQKSLGQNDATPGSKLWQWALGLGILGAILVWQRFGKTTCETLRHEFETATGVRRERAVLEAQSKECPWAPEPTRALPPAPTW